MALPTGVTLQQIDGGPTYYASNGLTYAANAGWDNASFIPIGPWEEFLVTQSDADRWIDLGWNTGFTITGNSSASLARSNGIWLIQDAGQQLPGTGAETVGNLTVDEPSTFAEGVSTPIGTTANSIQDGRFWWINNTVAFISYGGLNGAPAPGTSAAVLDALITTPNGTKRHIDASSLDLYWFAGAHASFWLSAGGVLDNLSGSMTTDQAARGSNYGDVISDERLATGGTTPIFGFVEDGGPYTQDTSASDYITPPELNWAVWSELIHGARGVIYFNHTFAGPEVSDDNLDQPYYQTVQPGQTVSIYTQVKNTDALVEQMAPVLNSPTALNYVSVNTPGYVNGVVDSLFSGIEVLAKDDNGQFYIFADTRDSMTQTNVAATFTLADKNATSVTVVGENRTIAVSNGVFTDTFATAATVHIYKVNDGTTGSGSTAPTVTGISDLPATGDLGAGKTVTLTLGFSSAVTVAGGKPTLTLNDGGTATYASGSGTSALTFTYAVAGGQSAASLAATAVNLGSGVTIKNSAGVAANLSLAGRTQSGPQIDTTAPAAPAISSDTVSGNIVMLKGTAAANSTVTVFDNSTKLGAAAANSSGAWTYTTGALANGSQSFNATATDGAGNVSPASSALAMTLVTTGSGASSGSDTDSSDFNGDGHSDILWQNTSGQAAIWEMNGTSQVVGGNALVGSNPGPSWKAIGTGDFNDDGHSDILWQNTNGQAAIWEMDGTNVIGGGTVSANPGPSWKAIGTGDFNLRRPFRRSCGRTRAAAKSRSGR